MEPLFLVYKNSVCVGYTKTLTEADDICSLHTIDEWSWDFASKQFDRTSVRQIFLYEFLYEKQRYKQRYK